MVKNFVLRQTKETVMTMETITTIITESLEEVNQLGSRKLKGYHRTVTVTRNESNCSEFEEAA